LGGAITLLCGSLVLGILLGAIYHLVARWMDLVVLFPLGFGMILGVLLAIPIFTAKIRHRGFVIFCAILASTFLPTTRLFCDSLRLREAMIEYHFARWSYATSSPGGSVAAGSYPEIPGVSLPDDAKAFFRRTISPLKYFRAYLKGATELGVVVGKMGKSSPSSDLVLRGAWFWALQTLNLVLISATAIAAALNHASTPFCPICRKWLDNARAEIKVHPDQSGELVEKLKIKDWQSAANIAGKNAQDKQKCVVSVATCATCGQAQLKVKTTRGVMNQTILEMPISDHDAFQLQAERPAQRL